MILRRYTAPRPYRRHAGSREVCRGNLAPMCERVAEGKPELKAMSAQPPGNDMSGHTSLPYAGRMNRIVLPEYELRCMGGWKQHVRRNAEHGSGAL